MQIHWIRMLMLPALIAVLAACGGSNEGVLSPDVTAEPLTVPQSTEVKASEVTEYGFADLLADLRATDLQVQLTQGMVNHGFAIQGQRVLVDGIPVFVYEFADAVAADLAFAGVSVDEYSMTVTRPDRDVIVETHSDWMESPHLYKRGRLIVIAGEAPDILDVFDTAMGSSALSPEPRECSFAHAFPPEEAKLIMPTLHQVQPDPAAPGQQVEIRGTGGFLYWSNECGEFRNESARDFQLSVDGKQVGSITCYAHTCLASLTIAADATPGTHTISVEGGSSIGIEVVGRPSPSQANGMHNLELVGFLGKAQARAVAVQGDYAYVGIDIELAVVDVSNSYQPRRVGHLFLPGPVMDIALVRDTEQDHTYAYVVVGNGAGLYVVEITDPANPVVLATYYADSYVSEILVAAGHAYVSGNLLHILDIADQARPVSVGTHSPTQSASGERVAAVASVEPQGRTYAYMAYDRPRVYGLQIIDVTDPAAPIELGSLTTNGPIHEVAIVGEHAYLLAGPGIGRLGIVDVSDPQNPSEVNSVLAGSWGSESLAVQDHFLYLAGHDLSQSMPAGGLQIMDIADPTKPMALGRYEGIAPPVRVVGVEGGRAYIAAGDGLAVLDVSDPNAPTGTGTYQANVLTGSGRDLAVEGSTVYIAAGDAGLQVVDASDPVNPRVVGSHDTAGHTWAIALAKDDPRGYTYAYLADEYNGLRVVDVSNPLAPVEVGACDLPGQEEFYHGVAVAGDHAYVADGGLMETGLRVFDISEPAHPFETAFLPLIAEVEGAPPSRIEGVSVADGYVYLAAGTSGLRVIDVSDPLVPVEIGRYGTPGRAANLAVAGSHVYIIDGDLRVVDVSIPTASGEVGFYDLPGMALAPHVTVQDHLAYLTGEGLRVLDISGPGAMFEVARHPIPQGSVAVTSGAVYVLDDGLFVLPTLLPTD